MPLIKPEVSENNEISLPFGFKIKLRQVFKDGDKPEVNLIESPDNNLFFGVFDVVDTKFEMILDNTSNDKDVRIGLKMVNTPDHSFFVDRRTSTTLRALETNGKHLHFLSQTTKEGKFLVGLTAKQNKISLKEAAVECSRIRFTVEIEQNKTIIGRIRVFVKTLTKTIVLNVGMNHRINDLKYLVYEREGILPQLYKWYFCGKPLEDNKTLSDYNIQNDSNIVLSFSLIGGVKYKPLTSGAFRGSDETPKNVGPGKVGKRGVVCFGKITDQKFTQYEGFVASKKYDIKPFTIEMRLKSKYSLK